MVRAQQGGAQTRIQYPVSELEICKARNFVAGFQDAQVRVERDFPQSDDNLNVGKQFQFSLEERTAIA